MRTDGRRKSGCEERRCNKSLRDFPKKSSARPAHVSLWDFYLSRPARRVNVRATVRNQIPIRPFRSDTIRRGIGSASLRQLRAVGRFSGPRPFRPQRVGRGTGPESIATWVGMFGTAAPRMGVVRSAAVAPAWVLAWIPTLLVAVTVIGAQQPVL